MVGRRTACPCVADNDGQMVCNVLDCSVTEMAYTDMPVNARLGVENEREVTYRRRHQPRSSNDLERSVDGRRIGPASEREDMAGN